MSAESTAITQRLGTATVVRDLYGEITDKSQTSIYAPPWKPSNYKRNTQKSPEMRCSTSSAASSPLSIPFAPHINSDFESFSGLGTETPGRVDKSTVLHALQNSGQSYDLARETLKHVSVDASGKVELEDWVEVRWWCGMMSLLDLY